MSEVENISGSRWQGRPDKNCTGCYYAAEMPRDPQNVLHRQFSCRRGPPTPVLIGQQFRFVYPLVTHKDLCGQFMPEPPKPANGG